MNTYLGEMDPSLNYWEFVAFMKQSFISSFSDHLNWTVIPVETNNQVQVILVKMKIIQFLLFYCSRIFELHEAHSKRKIRNYFKIEIWQRYPVCSSNLDKMLEKSHNVVQFLMKLQARTLRLMKKELLHSYFASIWINHWALYCRPGPPLHRYT